ncbi:hypothetical protein ACHAXA_006849 [Cyclostephanos tholiformis]|uniref:SPX domain-containing protein n=1 Tax=Cyclostephanos tholiformis TaxID=382380 RepID=A0ABD3R6U4_9STRA
MVGFGDVLGKSRRPVWETAYLDYEGLKAILYQLELAVVENAARLSFQSQDLALDFPDVIDENVRHHSTEFMSKLHSEIEKVTLFCLSRLGDLAHSLGALRFDTDTMCRYPDKNHADNDVESAKGSETDTKGVKNHRGLNSNDPSERDSLLTAADWRSYNGMPPSCSRAKANLFHSENLSTLIGSRSNGVDDKFGVYAEIGVELLHLLKFSCMNAVGIRKIVKKYEKTFLENPLVRDERVSEVKLNGNSSHDRLLQLTNNQSFNAIYASLLDGLAECDAAVTKSMGISRSHRRGLSEPILRSVDSAIQFMRQAKNDGERDSLSLLRLECTVLSINAIQDFANAISKPFQVFLSRKAMIGAGKDRGDMGSSNKRAIDVLVSFEPHFILEMSEEELHDWCQRAAARSTSQMKHRREPSGIGNPFLKVEDRAWGGVDNTSMVINLLSILLYTINYYIISPTANHYAILLGTNGAYGATLIGASSFAALFSAILYSVWYTRFSFRSALIFSAICPLVGNLLYSTAIIYKSMKLALLGRLLCGFGSAEVASRQLISDCVAVQTIIDMTAGRDDTDVDLFIHLPWSPDGAGVIFNSVTVPGYLMSFLWSLLLISLVFFFDEPLRINAGQLASDDSSNLGHKESTLGWFVNCTGTLFQVIFKNGAFPTTLYMFAFIELSGEVMISSCSMVVHRYFRWNGSTAGLIVASLGALVLPAHFIVERASHICSERLILKWSMVAIICSNVAILNFEGLALDVVGEYVEETTSQDSLVQKLRQVVKNSSSHNEFTYDWGFGVYVYICSLSLMFISTIVMEGVNTSLMSKTTPKELNNTFINMGLLATLVGTFGRVIGDSMITASAFFGRSPLHDFVSVTFFPMMPMILIGWYLVRRYYKFLLV